MDSWLTDHLVCPRDHSGLVEEGDTLRCAHGHRYPYIDGVPVMRIDEAERIPPDLPRELDLAAADASAGLEVDPFVQKAVMATCGILYRPRIGRLRSYPIPEIRLPEGEGRWLLDVGCNWGRWSVSAARRGYRVVGVDHNIQAIFAARRVARQLGVEARFVVADARFLPFADATFDVVFSYSVLQHLAKQDALQSAAEIGRTLRPGGESMVQLPNRWGPRSLYHQLRRGFRDPVAMEVRYWGMDELRREFGARVGPTRLSIDGFFGLGIQPCDMDVVPPYYRPVLVASEALRGLSRWVPGLIRAADSLYVHSVRGSAPLQQSREAGYLG